MNDGWRPTNSIPLFLYHEEWQPYRSANAAKPEKKSRPIRYGERRDAYIFAHYRRKLSVPYEQRLADIGISDCPIAYRQIPKPGTNGGKCNIDFAKDAFDEVDRLGDCVAVALDIKGYFENLPIHVSRLSGAIFWASMSFPLTTMLSSRTSPSTTL